MNTYSFQNHADHNREVCLLLNREKKYDWVVTTAFYSCIHRLYGSLFPLTALAGGKVVIFQSFADYVKHYSGNSNMGKHEMLGRAVIDAGISPKARTAYESLKSASFTARYNDYRTSQQLAQHAISKLDIVDQECKMIQESRSGSGV